jgi:hypothetical protein
MDHKSLKQDLTYCLKKFQKDGKVLVCHGDNLEVVKVDEKNTYSFINDQYDPLAALVVIKGYEVTQEHTRMYYDSWVDEKGYFGTPGATIHNSYRHDQGYNLSLIDLLVKETGIAAADWYAFLDGFENVAFTGKNEYYNVGVYLREKFLPVDVRTEPLTKQVYLNQEVQGTTVRKFVVYSFKGKTQVVEAECQLMGTWDDISINWMSPGEYKMRVLAPSLLFEKKPDGSFTPPAYMSHSLYDTAEEALEAAKKGLEAGYRRTCQKCKMEVNGQTLEEMLAKITTLLL